jgi:hypothetical protein
MWLFKRKLGTRVTAAISDSCHAKLPDAIKSRFYREGAQNGPGPAAMPTHTVETSDDGNEFFLASVVAEGVAIAMGNEDSPTENYSIPGGTDAWVDNTMEGDSNVSDEQDFGGGETDGGGSGDGY